MEIFKEIDPLRAFLRGKSHPPISIGIVPTMGALHEGHSSLLKASIASNDLTVCTLFINPAQFNNPADLEKYPRTVEKDIALLESGGCDVLFMPDTEAMYTEDPLLSFDFGQLDKVLEGKFRPGHFSGVALIVSKLFNIVEPSNAYFGQKDYQQFQILKCLVLELKFNARLHCLPTIRESDGLAMSSRNLRLSLTERKTAPLLYQSLLLGRKLLREGRPWYFVKEEVDKNIGKEQLVKLEYFELADRENLLRTGNVPIENAIILIAGFVGEVRLIDNLFIRE